MTATRLTDPDTVGAVAGLMRLLGDQTRVRVLGLLQNGEMNVTALCGRLDLAQPTVSHHLGLLRTAKLVRTRRDGKQIFYALNPDHVTTGGNGTGLRLRYGLVDLHIACDAPAASNGSDAAHPHGRAGEVNGNGARAVRRGILIGDQDDPSRDHVAGPGRRRVIDRCAWPARGW